MTAKHLQPGLSSRLYQPLGSEDVQKIADSAFEILSRSGVAVYSKTAREKMLAAGATEAGESILRLPRSMVEDAVASNPSSITLCSRDGEHDVVLEGSRVHYGTGGTALYVLDPATGERRNAEVRDVAFNARMIQNLPNVHLHTINVFPHDVSVRDDIDVNRFYHSLRHTTKHVMGGVYTLDGCRKAVRMAQTIAGGAEKLRERPFVSFITLIISPYKIDDDYGEMTCYLAEESLPVVVPTEPICGTTSPVTLAGNVLAHIAETLAGIVLVQSVNKGAPGICGSVGSIPDLNSMNHLAGAVERAMINAAVSQMAQHFQLPFYGTGGTTDALKVDQQSAYESAMSALLVAMSGANYIHDIAGLMESDLTVSYDKLALDNEVLGMCQRVLRGIEVNDDTLATDLVIEKGPTKDYMVEEHTLRYMREEFYMPTLTPREKRDQARPGDDSAARARQLVEQLADADDPGLLDATTDEQIRGEFPEILPAEPAEAVRGRKARAV